jgi:hypothetical protein
VPPLKLRSLFLIAVLVFAVLPLAGCSDNGTKWRQNLRVTVETPQGEVVGEAVSEQFAKELAGIDQLGGGAGVGGSVLKGEAAVADLGGGRYLFALIDSEDWYLTYHTLSKELSREGKKNYATAAREYPNIKGPRPVPPNMYPTLVTFTDLANPKSIKLVDPDNLAAAFGSGYRLRSITLEITDEKVTEGRVKELLGWLSDYYDKQLDGNKYHNAQNPKVGNDLMAGNFKTRDD